MINTKQRAFLRSMANRLAVTVMMGKEGINDNLLDTLNKSLIAHELVKITVLKTSPLKINEAKGELASATHSDIVQAIGSSLVLFRPNADSKIHLPK